MTDLKPMIEPDQIVAISHALRAEFDQLCNRPLAAGLYLVATPIGHLGDITVRALAILAAADRICCEDTRHSRHLLDRYGIRAKLTPYHEHNAERERPALIASLAQGQRIALISDAGTPLVSDPGFKLVRAAIADGISVFAVPGASATLAALSVAGLPTDLFTFAGFLPTRMLARQARLTELSTLRGTMVFFEAPGRVAATLADMATIFGAERPAALARELTKLHETVTRDTLNTLAQWAAEQTVKGECVIIVAGAPAPDPDSAITAAALDAALNEHLAHTSLRDAVRLVTAALKLPRSHVYARAVSLARDSRITKPAEASDR
jgi:16S rRNA (cytidine1402-2'-O)-methyltransferase